MDKHFRAAGRMDRSIDWNEGSSAASSFQMTAFHDPGALCNIGLLFFRWQPFTTVHSRYLIRGQNRYAKPMTEIPIKRKGQKANARRSRFLRRVRLEFGDVPTAATRIGAIVYATFRLLTKRQFAPTFQQFHHEEILTVLIADLVYGANIGVVQG
jgi:hypothetical protein